MSRLVRGLLRVAGLLLLAALLAGVPLLVFRLVGVPVPATTELRDAWSHRQIDGALVVRIGAAVFAVLWLWFAITALAELIHVMTWRVTGRAARLAPLPPGPTGLVRRLVRFVVVSSVTATATFGSFVPLATAAVSASVTPPVSIVASTISTSTHPLASPTHTAVGRETPFSLAAMIGSVDLREKIIELNLGRVGPDGRPWQGGVFPAGMEVALPDEEVVRTALGPAHEVVRGDSYWEIADDHLAVAMQRPASELEVKEYTDSLMTLNHGRLGHRDPALIVPGDLVVFTAVAGGSPVDQPLPVVEPVVEPVVAQPVVAEPVTVTEHQVALPDVVPHLPVATSVGELPVITHLLGEQPVAADSASGVAPAREALPVRRNRPSERSLPFSSGLGAALMLSAGAVGLLESRRRQHLRAATVGTRLSAPSAPQVQTEMVLRSLHAPERLARLDLALRSAAPSLAEQGASIHAAVVYDTGDVCLFVRGAATPALCEWKLDLHANTWRLSGAVSLATLATHARLCAQPCPAMVHVGGVAEGGELFVDLEAVGTLDVQSPHSAAILRSVAASLAVSPFIEAARLFTVGLGEVAVGASNSEPADSLDAALDAASMSLGSTAQLARDASTFGLRVAGVGGEAWEPSVVIAALDDRGVLSEGDLPSAASGGRGLAVVMGTSEAALEGEPSACEWALRCSDGHHTLEPLGLVVQPVGVSEADIAALTGLLAEVESAPPTLSMMDEAPPRVDGHVEVATYVEPHWSIIVRVFGQVQVASASGVSADCERSKATELIVWLSQHRERPTRTAARTALWDLDVRDATFANVVSDARRALARAEAPADSEEWIARTLTEDLPLHPGVVTDADLLAHRLEHARGVTSSDAIDTLRPGVEMLAGMPFAGTSYLWTDAEGITSSLILLATSAAIELANHYLLLGDVDGVFWATGQGLKVLSGHEELISLRMRAHARRGDLAGVRGEWESYERAIAADPWAAAEPAPKLVALRRELLTAHRPQQET